ncbi:MAG: hypothetical protein ABIG37_02175 [Nanoarchaeota archaeon]
MSYYIQGKMAKKILVIEDNSNHKQDAQEFFEAQPDVEVTYASNYSDAEKVMFGRDKATWERIKGEIDGVISDIYFPLTSSQQWDQPEPIGVRVAVELSQLEIPFVLNTAGYHHGRRYEWINQFARDQGWKLVDNCEDYEKDTDSKNWEEAYQSLEEKMK